MLNPDFSVHSILVNRYSRRRVLSGIVRMPSTVKFDFFKFRFFSNCQGFKFMWTFDI